MKIATAFIVLTISVAAASATTCTDLQVATVMTTPEFIKFNSTCGSLAQVIQPTMDAALLKQFCAVPACVTAVQGVVTVAPNCTWQNAELSAGFQLVSKTCAATTVDSAAGISSTIASLATLATVVAAAVFV